ncbi:hypothetical protein ACLOJK_006926 [Asimina triloba]
MASSFVPILGVIFIYINRQWRRAEKPGDGSEQETHLLPWADAFQQQAAPSGPSIVVTSSPSSQIRRQSPWQHSVRQRP